jgi:drug/metabolite transporter (DMT)-like permease
VNVLPSAPVAALLAGAALWGLVWYPFRVLAAAGLDGLWATVLAYGLAFGVGVVAFPRHALSLRGMPPLAFLMAAAIGWSNLLFVLGIVEGEVMRVLLLFYLAPLWTVPIARIALGERLDLDGIAVMALALAGAGVMLWRPDLGVPWPATRSEWMGVGAGFLFALGNVLVRRIQAMTDAGKSIAIWAGVTFAGLVHLPSSALEAPRAAALAVSNAGVLAGTAVALVAMSLAIQYGLARLPANRAAVILLFELVVAAIAAYFLTGERLRMQDWIGGMLIVAASLASGYFARRNRGRKPGTDT